MDEKKLNTLLNAIANNTHEDFCYEVCPIGKSRCMRFDSISCQDTIRTWLTGKLPEYCEECSRDDFVLLGDHFDEDGDKVVHIIQGFCRKCKRKYAIKDHFKFDRTEIEDREC